jgi:MFS family permease
MTQITEFAGVPQLPAQTRDAKVIGLVSGAHFISHLYMLVLPPIFLFVKADYAVSYAELGMVIATFNVVSAVFQTPAGFLVDRWGARRLLIGGLLVGAIGIAVAGLVSSYWALIAGFALMGFANTIYHPADYAILSHSIGSRRIGHAFSIHTFFGTLGTAIAPTFMLFLTGIWGWHGAFLGAAILATIMAAVLALNKSALTDRLAHELHFHDTAGNKPAARDAGWKLLLSPPILRNVAFFLVLSLASNGVQAFSIVALGALYQTPLDVANFALSAYLLLNALGVLAGGVVATRIRAHSLVAAVGFVGSGLLILVVGLVAMPPVLLIAVMGLSGFSNGIILPSRDMIVRAVTPPGSFGKVFGFVSMGFNLAGMTAPLLFGWLMDQGQPRSIFLLVVAFTVLSLPLLVGKAARSKA